MDPKTRATITATPVDEKRAPSDGKAILANAKVAAVTVKEAPTVENTPTSPFFSTETEWKITIQNSDGATSEILLSPTSVNSPKHQEIRILMPGAKEKDGQDMEADKRLTAEETAKKARRMQIYIIIQQSLTALFSTVIIIVMALTLEVYFNSQHVAGAWPKNPILAPTIVLLSMAALNCVADLIALLVHACHGKWVTRMTKTIARIRAIVGFLQAMATAAGAGYFQSAKKSSGNSDLWGYSCSDASADMQTVNNSNAVCNSNNVAFALAIGTVAIHVLSVVIAVWALLKPSGAIQDNAEEAAKLLGGTEDKEKKFVTNLMTAPMA